MQISRRRFVKNALWMAAQMPLMAVCTRAAGEDTDPLGRRAKQLAEALLTQMARQGTRTPDTLRLHYDVLLQVGWDVTLNVRAAVWMQRVDTGYEASFRLAEPEGANGWSWLMLKLFGQHTQDYREMIRGIEIGLLERFHLHQGRFRTDLLEEILPETKDYENQTAIKVQFEYRQQVIRFWEDKLRDAFTQQMAYTGQIAPLTALFNYLFFEEPVTEMALINVLKQVADPDPAGPAPNRREVHYLFEAQPARFDVNHSAWQPEYGMRISFARGNFLDVVFGEYVYYRIARVAGSRCQIPFAVRIEGIISKSKKRKKISRLKKRFPLRDSFEEELLREADDILAARDIKMYLTGYDVQFAGGTPPRSRRIGRSAEDPAH